MLFKKIFCSLVAFAALIIFFDACKTTKQISTSPKSQQIETASSNKTIAQVSTVANEPTSTQSECLPQDKVFLDSLKMNRCKYKEGGYNMTYDYIDTIPDIVKKLFPNVIFYNSTTWVDIYAKPYLSAHYNGGNNPDVVRSFNSLFKEIHGTNEYNLEDKITAFLYMFYGFNSTISIIEVKDCNIDIPYAVYTFNIQVNAIINRSNLNLLFYIKNFQLLDFIEIDSNNKVKNSLSPYETP